MLCLGWKTQSACQADLGPTTCTSAGWFWLLAGGAALVALFSHGRHRRA